MAKRRYYKKYSPSQKRDGNGKWTAGAAGAGKSKKFTVTKASAKKAGAKNRKVASAAVGGGGRASSGRMSRQEGYAQKLKKEKSARRRSAVKKGAIGLAAVGAVAAVGYGAKKSHDLYSKPRAYDRNTTRPGDAFAVRTKHSTLRVNPYSSTVTATATRRMKVSKKDGGDGKRRQAKGYFMSVPEEVHTNQGVGAKAEAMFTRQNFANVNGPEGKAWGAASRRGIQQRAADDARKDAKMIRVPEMDKAAIADRLAMTKRNRELFKGGMRPAPSILDTDYGPEMTKYRKGKQKALREDYANKAMAEALTPKAPPAEEPKQEKKNKDKSKKKAKIAAEALAVEPTVDSPIGMTGARTMEAEGPAVPFNGIKASGPSKGDIIKGVGAAATVVSAGQSVKKAMTADEAAPSGQVSPTMKKLRDKGAMEVDPETGIQVLKNRKKKEKPSEMEGLKVAESATPEVERKKAEQPRPSRPVTNAIHGPDRPTIKAKPIDAKPLSPFLAPSQGPMTVAGEKPKYIAGDRIPARTGKPNPTSNPIRTPYDEDQQAAADKIAADTRAFVMSRVVEPKKLTKAEEADRAKEGAAAAKFKGFAQAERERIERERVAGIGRNQLDGMKVTAGEVAERAEFGIDAEGYRLNEAGQRDMRGARGGVKKPLVHSMNKELASQVHREIVDRQGAKKIATKTDIGRAIEDDYINENPKDAEFTRIALLVENGQEVTNVERRALSLMEKGTYRGTLAFSNEDGLSPADRAILQRRRERKQEGRAKSSPALNKTGLAAQKRQDARDRVKATAAEKQKIVDDAIAAKKSDGLAEGKRRDARNQEERKKNAKK